MKFRSYSAYLLSLLVLVLLLTISLPIISFAQERDEDSIIVDSIPRVAIIWFGNKIIHPQLQPAVFPASEVEVRAEEVVYTSSGERYVFWSWSDGVKDNPRRVSAGQDAIAIYKRQVRIEVINGSGSGWYFVGERVKIWVENTVVYLNGRERLIFKGWAGARVGPASEVYITASTPLVIEAIWEKQYKLETIGDIELIGEGWYEQGSQAIVYAPLVSYISGGERLKFSQLIPLSPNLISCLSPECNIVTVAMSNPAVIAAEYVRECKLDIILPEGAQEKWHPCGSITTVKAEQFIEISEDIRLRFKRWIINGEEYRDLIAAVKVNGPTMAIAEYVKEYMVKIVSPMGTDIRWVEEGRSISLTPPRESTTYLLANFNFKGWRGYGENSSLTLDSVNEPMTIRAEYALEPDYISIASLLGSVSAIIIVYTFVRSRRASPTSSSS